MDIALSRIFEALADLAEEAGLTLPAPEVNALADTFANQLERHGVTVTDTPWED